jgi:drug/metabolite transporter (DMT)-like permease
MIFEISAQTLFKTYYIETNMKKNAMLVVGLLLYSLSGVFVFKLLQYGSLGIINIMWHMLHFLSLFLVGRLVFREKYSAKQLVACVLALFSLYLFMTEQVDHH